VLTMQSSEQRSPVHLPYINPRTGQGVLAPMRVGPKLTCPFCEAEYLYDDIEINLPMIRTGREEPYNIEGTGEAYQCICGAWFIGGMPDE
jgi:hypothetical protein